MALGGVGTVVGEDVEAVLLDGLGTLVALEPPWRALVEGLREGYGLELDLRLAERAFRAEMAYYRAHHHEARDRDTLDDLRRRCAKVLSTQLPVELAGALSLTQLTAAMLDALHFSVYPDAPPALRALRARGFRLVVASNWDISLPAVLQRVGVAELVDGVLTSAQVGSPKPQGAIFAAALALTGTAPRRTVHVGDSIAHDVRGALGAGVRPVLLRREDRRQPPGEAWLTGEDARLTHEDVRQPPAEAERQALPPGVPVIASLAALLA